MSGGLSQDEINALLAGSTNEEVNVKKEEAKAKPKRGRKKKNSAVDDCSTEQSEIENLDNNQSSNIVLTDLEKDILGEVGNISMGSASTALSNMVGKKVNITTPVTSITTLKKIRDGFEIPNIAFEIKYVTGIVGKNIFLMRVSDAAVISNLMMGGTGQVDDQVTLSEIEESAASEAMNQMIGSAATAMATMFSRKVDISPPKSKIWDSMTSSMSEDIEDEEDVVQVSFKLSIEGLLDSSIMQVLSLETVNKIVSIMMGTDTSNEAESNSVVDSKTVDIVIESNQDAVEKIKDQVAIESESKSKAEETVENSTENNYSDNKMQKFEYKQFNDFDNVSRNTSSLFDVPLNIQVVLGNAQRSIKEIMNFKNGTLLELNQLENQPVELHINGKIVAYGEVVTVNGNLAINIIDVNKNNI